MEALVTVIIPCHNVEHEITRSLASLLPVASTVARVVCVDNNSKDGTVAAIERWAAEQTELEVVLRSEEVQKAMAARFKGLEDVETALVHFLDGDDEVHAAGWESQIEQYRELDLWSQERTIWVSGIAWKTLSGREVLDPPYVGDPRVGLMRGEKGMTSSMVWPATILQRARERIGGRWYRYPQGSDEYRLLFECLRDGAEIKVYEPHGSVCYDRVSGRINQANPSRVQTAHSLLRTEMFEAFRSEVAPEVEQDLKQALFISLMHLSKTSRVLATQLYRESLSGFQPRADAAVPRIYVLTFKLLGFNKTNRVMWRLLRAPRWGNFALRVLAGKRRKRRPLT